MMNPTLGRQPFLRRSRLAVLAAGVAVTIPMALLAQSGSGAVRGTVRDSAGHPWAGAQVTVSPVGQPDAELQWKSVQDQAEVLGEEHAIVFLARRSAEGTNAEEMDERILRVVEAQDGETEPIRRELHVLSEAGDGQARRIKVSRARWSTRTDDVGGFEILDVPPGDYRLEVRLPGFASVDETVTVEAGQATTRDIALEVGSLEETYTVAANAPSPVPTATDPAALEERRQRIGDGPLQPPIKLRDLTPAYPAALRASGAQGTVILEAVVAADGTFQVLNVLTPVDPDLLTPVQPELARAAVDATRQWQFEPTRLHGVPVDTRMKVTVNFTDES